VNEVDGSEVAGRSGGYHPQSPSYNPYQIRKDGRTKFETFLRFDVEILHVKGIITLDLENRQLDARY
jgi:hypothetical protein